MANNKRRQMFESLVMPHLDSAFNLARYITGNNDDASDLVQDSFLKAFQAFDRYHDKNSKAWILTIVRNTCYTFLSRNHTRPISFDELLHTTDSVNTACHSDTSNLDSQFSMQEQQNLIQHAISSLPTEFRDVIILRELEELSYRDIATILDIPQGTVMSRLSRAREYLKKILADLEEVTE